MNLSAFSRHTSGVFPCRLQNDAACGRNDRLASVGALVGEMTGTGEVHNFVCHYLVDDGYLVGTEKFG